VTSLAHQIWPDVYSEMISGEQIEYMLDWMYSPEKIREEIRSGIRYQLIKRQGKPIGFFSFGPLSPGEPCFIHKIYVAPDHHRKGFGSRALLEIERMASTEGASGLELRVNRENKRAIALYHQSGFQITAEDCADIGGGFVMDDYIFRKDLTPPDQPGSNRPTNCLR
jgi:ribosomal protein S18 acetylase RimI-like enzyme